MTETPDDDLTAVETRLKEAHERAREEGYAPHGGRVAAHGCPLCPDPEEVDGF